MRRVVITAAGPVTAIGIGQECFTEGILEGGSGIMEIAAFEHEKYDAHLAAAVEDFEVKDFLPTPKNYLDRNTELSFGAFSLALKASGIDLAKTDKSELALIWSTAFGGTDTMNLFYSDVQKKGPRFGKPILFPHTYSNTAISMLSIEYKLNGPHMNFVSGWTASGQALAYGYDLVASGRVPVAFVGGAESFNETIFRFCCSRKILLSSSKENAYMSFDGAADGTIMGEGAGMLVLEDMDHALKRGANILAEITGAGIAGSPGALKGTAVEDAMSKAIGNLNPCDVDCVLASANGIQHMDKAESAAIQKVFGVNRLTTTIKPLIGETFGAAGILQLHAALSILDKQFVPGVKIASRVPEAEKLQIPAEGCSKNIRTVLLNNLDPNGNAVSLVIRKI
ncbi:MAG: beta-ketoacyl synthase N-terminal-like domain-containing protein [Victivallales bacterium]